MALNPKLTLKIEINIIAKIHRDFNLIRFFFAAFYAISLADVFVKFILSREITIKVSTNSEVSLMGIFINVLQILKGNFINQNAIFIIEFTKFYSRSVVLS